MILDLVVMPCRFIDLWLGSIHEHQRFYLLPKSDSGDKTFCYILGLLEKKEKDAMLVRCWCH